MTGSNAIGINNSPGEHQGETNDNEEITDTDYGARDDRVSPGMRPI
jgi:hypothetical protein